MAKILLFVVYAKRYKADGILDSFSSTFFAFHSIDLLQKSKSYECHSSLSSKSVKCFAWA
jgi:hypothetical protein